MATAADVARALTDVHTKIAKDLDDAPTGVEPGYSAALRATVLPNGKLRYVEGSTAGTVGARVERTTNFALTTSGSEYAIDFESEDYDDAAYWAIGTPTDLVVPSTGYLDVDYTVIFAANATGQREAFVRSSAGCGLEVGGRMRVDASASGTTILSGSHHFRLAAGCVIRLYAVQTSGGALNVSSATCTILKVGPVPV